MNKQNSDFAENIPPRRFVAPTVQQVAAYCRERGNQVDPRTFVDFYTARGWKMGRALMKDWKAAVRTWEHNDTNRQNDAAKSIRETLSKHAAWDAWKDMPDGPEKYHAYLCSPDWGQRRAAVAERSHEICERCRVNPASAVHHKTYDHQYDEPLEDLIHECQGCHDFTHGRRKDDPIMENVRKVGQVRLDVALNKAGDAWMKPASIMLCPACRIEYVHFDAPQVSKGRLVLPCWCESGHRWDVVLEHAKGQTFAFYENFVMQQEYQDVDSQERPAVSEGTSSMGLLEDDHAGPADEDAAPRDGLTSQFYGSENLDDV